MNDLEIRQNFHKTKLRRQHAQADTLVIDELGLNHGQNRADIAVINGSFIGYEIKSNNDSLLRLENQIKSYNSIFDKTYIVAGDRHINTIHKYLPSWWGIIEAVKNAKIAISFKVIRKARKNLSTQPICIARLLWRDEAIDILKKKKLPSRVLRQPRAILYKYVIDSLGACELHKTVRSYLKKRNNWRCPTQPSLDGGLSQPVSR